ncbi:unnamed protein product [Cyprideis torosa]|uniref:Uncharacterized protein n=1 Tax=Cyprideis torosa TaxID=163714 RepID=A0A7R8ZVB4_9CRUS|nr:unnamed protein product [Cyprideis torosa]CAG0902762.1 unnamed protein product [Cyprideis torosa]
MVVHSNSPLITSNSLLSVSSMINLTAIETEDQSDKLSQSSDDTTSGGQTTEAAKAVFICCPKSHPFQERTIILNQPVKIGRSVAKAKVAVSNAIFDCKVLSRNHALIWYEDEKFWLQDTKSSNGTFVNDNRLNNKSNQEGPPTEIFSGDTVKFGVEVVETNQKNKVTHGCIIATLRLFHPDGRETKPSPASAPFNIGSISTTDLYQLQKYIQEASQREKQLQSKMAVLQALVDRTKESSEGGWKALVDEDRVLSKLETLEGQMQIYAKNLNDEKWAEELSRLRSERVEYESKAKESVRKVLQEKVDVMKECEDLKRKLVESIQECTQLQKTVEFTQRELDELAANHQSQIESYQELQEKVEEMEKVRASLEEDKAKLEKALNEHLENEKKAQEESILTQNISLISDGDKENMAVTTIEDMANSDQKLLLSEDIKPALPVISSKFSVQQVPPSPEFPKVENLVSVNAKNEIPEPADFNREQIQEIQVQLKNLENASKEMEARLEDSRREKEEAEKTISQLREKTEALQAKLSESENVLEKQKKLVQETETSKKALEDKLKEKESELKEMCKEEGSKAEERERLQKEEMKRLTDLLEDVQSKKRALQSEIEELQRKAQEADAEKSSQEETWKKNLQAAEEKSKQLSQLGSQLRHRELESEELSRALLTLEAEKEELLRLGSSRKSDQSAHVVAGMDSADQPGEEDEMALQLSILDERLTAAQDEIRHLKEAYQSANEERSFIREQRDVLQREYRDLVAREGKWSLMTAVFWLWVGVFLNLLFRRLSGSSPQLDSEGDDS